jgi:hypothetical protein
MYVFVDPECVFFMGGFPLKTVICYIELPFKAGLTVQLNLSRPNRLGNKICVLNKQVLYGLF